MNPKLCPECFINRSTILTMLCENCNLKIHGNTILYRKSAEYLEAIRHTQPGGTFRKYENGELFLNEKSLVFVKDEKKEEKELK